MSINTLVRCKFRVQMPKRPGQTVAVLVWAVALQAYETAWGGSDSSWIKTHLDICQLEQGVQLDALCIAISCSNIDCIADCQHSLDD